MKEVGVNKESSLDDLSIFSLDFASKGLSWGESICQKLDNVIQDNFIAQDPAMFIDELGDHLRKIYVGIADDWLNPFSDSSIECSNPDLLRDMKDKAPEAMKDLDAKLTKDSESNDGLESTKSPGHHIPVPLDSIPLNSSFKEEASEVHRNIISSPPETHGKDSSNITGQATSLSSSSIQYTRLTKVPVQQNRHELSTVIGHDHSLCSIPRDLIAAEEAAEDCKDTAFSPVKPTENELTGILNEANKVKDVSHADGNHNVCSDTQHIPTSIENKDTNEPGNALSACTYSEKFHESSDIPDSNMTTDGLTDLDPKAATTEEVEDTELHGWDDSVLNEILLISQDSSSRKASGKTKLGRLAAIASRFLLEKKKNDERITTWNHGNYRNLGRKKEMDRSSVSMEDLSSSSSSESLETCESDWEIV